MSIDINKIAKLSNIELTPEQSTRFKEEIGEVIEYSVEQLGKVNDQTAEPSLNYTQSINDLSKDEPRPSMSTEEVLLNTKQKKDSLFKIKAVME